MRIGLSCITRFLFLVCGGPLTSPGSGGTFSNSASRATLRQRLDHEWVARLRRWRGCGPATLLGVRRCQQRCFSLSSGLQALNHVLDRAESGGLHHERMCGAAELMSNTRMHRASKQKHHLDNLVRRSLGCTECHADRRSRFNVYMKAVFSGHYHIDKHYFQKWERTAHGRTTGLLRLRKHPGCNHLPSSTDPTTRTETLPLSTNAPVELVKPSQPLRFSA